MSEHELSDKDLAQRMYKAERSLDFDTVLYCENEIAGRLSLPLNETEQGLTPTAAAKITDFVEANRY